MALWRDWDCWCSGLCRWTPTTLLVGELKAGPEIFVLSGVAMVGSAVWLIMNNTPIIVAIVYGILGRINSLKAVMRTAVAYPMSAKFLTGLTVAMFAMIIFNLMIFAILNNLGKSGPR